MVPILNQTFPNMGGFGSIPNKRDVSNPALILNRQDSGP